MKKYLSTTLLGVLAVVFTILVKIIDVAPIGPLGSEVGFANLNAAIFSGLGANPVWDKIADVAMILVFASGSAVAVMGAYQWIKRKKIMKVDWEILSLGIVYVILGIVYVLFQKVAINYRPTLENGQLMTSFPSSHVLLAITVGVTLMMILPKYIKNQTLYRVIKVGLILLIFVTMFGRLASGMHWLTDIVAAILYSAVLISLYVDLRQIKMKGEKNE